jgi:hypothetical protein
MANSSLGQGTEKMSLRHFVSETMGMLKKENKKQKT